MGIVRERQAAAAAAASAGADAKDATSSTTFVNKLIELYTHVSAMVHEEFGTHVEFQKAMRDAFETFVNKVRLRAPAWLAGLRALTHAAGCGVAEQRRAAQCVR